METNEIVLCPEENRKEQKELFKMMDIIERVELYHSWCDPTTVGNVTKGKNFYKNVLVVVPKNKLDHQ